MWGKYICKGGRGRCPAPPPLYPNLQQTREQKEREREREKKRESCHDAKPL